MREIKFRGKRTDNKEWVYGSLDLCGDTPFMTWREVDSDGDTVPRSEERRVGKEC